MPEISLTNVAGGFVEIIHGNGNRARENDSSDKSCNFKCEKKNENEDQPDDQRVTECAERRKQAVDQLRRPKRKRRSDGNCNGVRRIAVQQSRVEGRTAANGHIVPG